MAAQAANQLTRIDNLDDLLRYLTEDLGYEKYPALWKMEECLWAGQFSPVKRQLYLDGKPKDDAVVLDRVYFVDKRLDLNSRDWVRIVPPIGFEWGDYRYTVAEQVVRRVLPHHPQTAPDQQEAAGCPSAVQPSHQPVAAPLKPKAWLPLEHKRRQQLNDIPKEITTYTQQLHEAAVEAVGQRRLTNAPTARRLETLLHDLGLFPKIQRRTKDARKTHD